MTHAGNALASLHHDWGATSSEPGKTTQLASSLGHRQAVCAVERTVRGTVSIAWIAGVGGPEARLLRLPDRDSRGQGWRYELDLECAQ